MGYYDRAVTLDRYLAVAYFQRGVSNFLQEKFEDALTDFNNTLTYMRGNKWIDYDQLGLKHKLWSCEARFNRGLCYFYLQDMGIGMHDLVAACREKGSPTHDVIDEAIRDNAEVEQFLRIRVWQIDRGSGLSCFLNPGRLHISSQRGQNQKYHG